MTTRRELLLATLGAASVRTAPLALSAALTMKADAAQATDAGEWRNRQSGMSYRRLGRTGYMISEVVMGGNHIKPDNHEHVLMAIDHGLNYLDTAPAYGNGASEAGYARVLKARPRDKFFLNSKVSLWDLNRATVYRDIYASLSEPERKRIDTAVIERLESTGALRPDYVVNYFARQRGEIEDATLGDVMSERYG
ncbi:MAG: aldo/keto reductase, partial [Bryobacterales bacterium]|nr:aldo/keto reductase [Bryobacterales bacterium]